MQKHILLLIALCLYIAARGQTEYEYEYWFDNDRSTLQKGHSTSSSWKIEADLSTLDEKLHAIHVQVCDSDGVFSTPVTRYFIKALGLAGMTVNCWFDNDISTMREGENIDNTIFFDVSDLDDGYHTLQIQACSGSGAASESVTRRFIKIPQTAGIEECTCLCMIDDEIFKQEKVPVSQGLITWDFDVSSLPQGFHRIFIQIVTPSGAASNVWQSFFLREPTLEEYGELKCVYAIDGAEFYTETSTMKDGCFHFDLDVSSLENGLHRITYMLNNGKGVTTKTQTQFFTKIPLGGNGISEYWYWLNDLGDEQARKVTLSDRTNPFSLISLLPVESQPIRSKLFQFCIEDNKPFMYAKNDIHLRFYDAAGRFTDITKQFVDESVKQEVHLVGELQATQTFPKVAETDIKWYTLQAEAGDSLTFKSSQATTIQLFSSSGEELYSASGSESVIFGGCHTWETGTHYLAVHDVTGSRPNMTLDYEHIDKYAVLEQDVTHVGNGGFSTITFKGNGFDNLYAVDLFTANGDTIHSLDVNYISNVETAVTFDFTGAELGKYSVVFRFTEEDKYFPCHVIVEEAKDIELATTVTFPSAFPHGRSTTYTVKITNKGNMTAYSVPVYTWIMNKLHKDGIYHIEYDGLNLPGLFDGVDMDSLSVSEKAELQALSDEMGDTPYFMLFRVEDEDSPGDSVWVRSNYFFTNIAPYETKTLRLTLSANEGVWAYFTVPEGWNPIYSSNLQHSRRVNIRENSLSSGYCCVSTMIECSLEVKSTACDIVSPVLGVLGNSLGPDVALASVATALEGCQTSINNDRLKTFNKVFCSEEDNNLMDRLKNSLKASYRSSWSIGTIISCVGSVLSGAGLPIRSGIIKDCLSACANGLGGAALGNDFFPTEETSCHKLRKPIPNCPPTPPGGGGSKGGKSHDPNDIYGYLSQADSKFIADSVARVNYTIEFENDTTFATAAAHTIIIKDTLDSQYFDFTKFMPSGIKIGEHEAFLDEADVVIGNDKTTFIKTIDMRPEINAIAQVDGTFSHTTGIAEWRFTSLDPMTMEPTDDLMQGILPVNYNGTSGIGEVLFEIGMKQGKADGTEIKNRAGIVFDYEEVILTPTWTNIVDAVAPSSIIDNSWMVNDSTLRITADGFDARSGVWKYTWYVQAGENAPWWKEGETDSCSFDYHIFEGIDYGFCVLATDSAGNVEQKVIQRERGFKTYGPDYEDGIDSLTPDPSPEGEGSLYDLSGRQIGNGKSSNGNYPKGVIIRNRKKTLVTE